ncbi:hypothetical protein PAGU2595_028170 [Lysobacter xanthus]
MLRAEAGDGAVQAVPRGSVGRIGIDDPTMRRAFVDALALAPRPAAPWLAGARTAWRLHVGPAPEAVAVIGPIVERAMDPTVHECVELAREHRAGDRAAPSPPAGLLVGIAPETPISALDWVRRVELDFLGAWLREPEWLLIDGVFDDPRAADVAHLPALFHRRFPLRTITFLGRTAPALAGAVPAPLLRF